MSGNIHIIVVTIFVVLNKIHVIVVYVLISVKKPELPATSDHQMSYQKMFVSYPSRKPEQHKIPGKHVSKEQAPCSTTVRLVCGLYKDRQRNHVSGL